MKGKNGVVAKPKNTFKTIKRVFGYMFSFKIQLFFVFISMIMTSLARVVGTGFLKVAIDRYIEPLTRNYSIELMSGFIRMLAIMALIYMSGAVCSYIYNRIMVSVVSKTLYRIRTDLFNRMEKLPIKFFDTHTHGELMGLFTNDTDAIREMLSESFPSCILSSITITAIFSMLVYYNWQLTIIITFMLALILFCVRNIAVKSSRYFKEQQSELGKVNGFIEEMIEGQKVVKVFCHERLSKLDFSIINERLCDASTIANGYANILMPIMINLSNISYAVVAMVGSLFVIAHVFSLGTLVAFLQYTRTFIHPVAEISQQFNSILSALAGAERIFKVIDEKPELDDGTVILVNAKIDEDCNIIETNEKTNIWAWKEVEKSGKINYYELKGEIEFKDVIFKYDGEKTILDTINLKANMGEKIALVGSTGAGKTTITNLINRFYDIQSGEITFDGINIRKIKKSELRKTISIVLQDTHLFTETVMENIRYGNLNATDAEVISAAKMANADQFIQHLPQKYDTILTGDAANLSQGERQLLAIARAIVADPPVLILDEATSSIDTRTEKLIEQGMDSLMKGRTVFIIAHRLSTVRNSDSIIVLESGKIIEQGNHSELLDNRGRYYQLYSGMFELE